MTARPGLRLPPPGSWSAWYVAEEQDLLGDAESALAALAALAASPDPLPDGALVGRFDDLRVALDSLGGLASTVARAHPREDVRRRAGASLPKVGELVDRAYLLPGLHHTVTAALEGDLAEDERRVLDLELVELQRRGAGLGGADLDALAAIGQEESRLALAFEDNLLAEADVLVPVADLADVPATLLSSLPVLGDHVRVPLAPRRLAPVLVHVGDRALRERLHGRSLDRGRANRSVLLDLLDVRHRRASLLGHADPAGEQLVGQMLDAPEEVAAFLDRLSTGMAPWVARERAHLLARVRRDEPDAADATPADALLHGARAGDGAARPAHGGPTVDTCVDRLLDLSARALGLRWVPSDVPTWSPDVRVLDCVGPDGDVIGRAHLDLAPRPGKFDRPVHMALRPGSARILPEGALLCSFATSPTPDEQRVLAHEFGHLLHHLRGSGHDLAALNGISAEVDLGEAVADLVERCLTRAPGGPGPGAAATAYPALDLARQVHLAALSLHLHAGSSLDEAVARALPHSPWPDHPDRATSFGHVVSMGATYYTYVWSRALVEHLSQVLLDGDGDPGDALARLDALVLRRGARLSAIDLVGSLTGARLDPAALADSLVASVARLSPDRRGAPGSA